MLVTFAGIFLIATPSRAAEPIRIDVPARTTPVNFATEIAPLLRANCVACHNAKKAEGNLNLENVAAILKGGDQGPAVVAGKSDESLLLAIAAHQEATTIMPPPDNIVGARPLTPSQLGLLKVWIDQGATGQVSAAREIRWQSPPSGYQPALAAAVTADGQYAVCSRGRRLAVYHIPTGQLTGILVDPSLASAATVAPAGDAPPTDAHLDMVRSLAFDATGDLLASGGFREVKLWRRPRVTRKTEWAHEAPLRATAVRRDGLKVATGDDRGRIQVRESATGKVLLSFAAHDAAVTGIAFQENGAGLYSCSLDMSVRAWSAAGEPVGKPLTLASSVQTLAAIDQDRVLITGEQSGKLLVWDAAVFQAESDPKPKTELAGHGGGVTTLVAIDGRPQEFLSGGADRLIRRYDVAAGKQLAEYRLDSPIVAVAANENGRRIAAVGTDALKVWDETGKPIAQVIGGPTLAAKVSRIDSEITFTKALVARSDQDLRSYEGLIRIAGVRTDEIKKAEEARTMAEKTRDEKKAALEKAKAANEKTEAQERALADAETAVLVAGTVIERAKAVAERTAKQLAEAQQELAAQQELQKRQEAAKAEAEAVAKAAGARIQSLAFLPDGRQLAAGGGDGTLYVLDAETGTLLQTLANDRGAASGLISVERAGSETLISTSADGRSVVWNAPSSWRLERVIGGLERTDVLVDRVLSVDFSRDGRWLATGGGLPSQTGEVKLFDVADGKLVREFAGAHTETVSAVRFSPDGQRLASASGDRLVKVFDANTGTESLRLAGHTAPVLSVSWKADGKTLISSGADNAIKQWDVDAGLFVRTIKGGMYGNRTYKGAVTSVSFIGASEEIVAVSGDGTVRMHRSCSELEVMTFTGSSGYQFAVAATPDGKVVLASSSDGTLRVWSGHQPQLKVSLSP